MGNAASDFNTFGKKVREGFDVVGKKMGEGWESVKGFGKKAWEKIKSVPVLGQIAGGIEKYTPIGMAATNLIKGIDAGVGGTSKLFQGDVKGAISTATSYGRDMINQKNPILEAAKKVPGIGKIASGIETAVSNVPVYGGMSINTLRSIGNAGVNAVDSFNEGDVLGGLKNVAKGGAGYLGSKGGKLGMAGKLADKIF
jgi:hypothetical protein